MVESRMATSPIDPSPPLDRRMATPARADRLSVAELMRLAAEGRLRIPSFQRPMLWERSHKQDLLDSMERGYPVGTLLFWKRRTTDADLGDPLPGAPPTPPAGDVLMLIDGQQRTAALWEALGRPRAEGELAMLFEPQRGFVYRKLRRTDARPEVAGNPAPPLPLFHALDAAGLSEWVSPSLARDVRRRYFDVGMRLRDYLMPIYIVEGDDLDVLREIFDRVNSSGKPLSRDHVFQALVGSRIARGNASGLSIINGESERSGFGAIDESTLLKVFEAVRGDEVGKADVRKVGDLVAVEVDLEKASRALSSTVRFLQAIGVPHNNVLPYELPLLVIARFFALHPEPEERTRVLLRRWFWRGCLAERLAGSSGSLQQHVNAVEPGNEHTSAHRLIALSGDGSGANKEIADLSFDQIVASFHANHARAKSVLCALYTQSPRSLIDGEKLASSDLFGRGSSEAFRSIIQSESTVQNRLLHPGVPGKSPARLILDCDDEAALLSHDITLEARAGLKENPALRFFQARAVRQREHLKRFFERQAEWARDDSPPVRAIASGVME